MKARLNYTLRARAKGQMRVIETILAIFVILFALAFVYFFLVPPSSSPQETGELERIGYTVLHDLDEQRLLGGFIYGEEWVKTADALMVSLPSGMFFDLTVYDLDGNMVNSVPIRHGDPQVFETSGSVASVEYGVPGYQMNYEPRILILQLVRG